ncbi:MAG: hypothetical protein FJ206_14725 [Gemmatimonadetes bacterium]|nr:hypothetical protein [Gemmatimonadota bacterium]
MTHRPGRLFGWIVAGWIVQTVVAAQAQVWYLASAGEPVPWRDLAYLSVKNLLIWIPLSLGAVKLAKAIDYRRVGVIKAGAAQIAGAAIACVVDAVVDVLAGRSVGLQVWSGTIPAAVFRQANANLFSYGVVLAIYYAVEHAAASRDRLTRAARLEAQLTRARLDLLRMQLQPHFLFNTLHGISAVVFDRPKDAERMLTRLGDLLRVSAADLGRVCVSLDEELAVLEAYLDIERTRFQDRLTVAVEVAPEARSAAVPNLLLQPLVENAIKHGIAVHRGRGEIRLTAERHADQLEIVIANRGAESLADPATFREGVGLANTRQRLTELYRERFRLVLRPAGAGGLEVRVTIPFQTIDEFERAE